MAPELQSQRAELEAEDEELAELDPEPNELVEHAIEESRPDSVDALRIEIARAGEKARALQRANSELAGKALTPKPHKRKSTRGNARVGLVATYRDPDPRIELEQRLEEANGRVADLAIENAVLVDRKARRRRLRFPAFAVVGVLAAAVFMPLLLDTGWIVWFELIGGLGALHFVWVGRIKPQHPTQKR